MTDETSPPIRYVQRNRRNGQTYLYFRKGDYREGPLLSPDGSEALRAEVAAILRRLATAETAAKTPRPNTIGGMLSAYNKSAEFLSKARSTQRGYQDHIDEMIADFGNVMLFEVTQAWLRSLRDAWATRGHRAANNRMQVLKNALAPAIDDQTDDRISGDPFAKLAKVTRPHALGEPHPTWTDHEVSAVIEECLRRGLPGLARAVALGRYAGFRRQTICALPLSARVPSRAADGSEHIRLYWITEKRKVTCDKREDPRLTALLESTPDRGPTVAYNDRGQPFRERGLNQSLDRVLVRLAKAGKVRAGVNAKGELACPLDIHGLRHARGNEIAEAGGSDAEIMSHLEHATDRAARIYRRQASRRRLADAAQDRIDQSVRAMSKKDA